MTEFFRVMGIPGHSNTLMGQELIYLTSGMFHAIVNEFGYL